MPPVHPSNVSSVVYLTPPPFFFFFESWLTLAYNFGIVSFHCQFFFLCERKIHHRHRTQTRHTHNTETQNKRQKLGAKWIIFKRHLEGGGSISPFWRWVLLFFLWTRTSFIFCLVFFFLVIFICRRGQTTWMKRKVRKRKREEEALVVCFWSCVFSFICCHPLLHRRNWRPCTCRKRGASRPCKKIRRSTKCDNPFFVQNPRKR